VEKVEEHISDALSKGAKILTGGQAPRARRDVLRAHRPRQRQHHHESTGKKPSAPSRRSSASKTKKKPIKTRQRHRFGLASYFYGRDVKPRLARRRGLEYGIVGINTGTSPPKSRPVGGVKESGMGREGSKYGSRIT